MITPGRGEAPAEIASILSEGQPADASPYVEGLIMDASSHPKHGRRSIRLKGYDYSQAGAYFVTLATHQRANLFGAIEKGEMLLNPAGQIVVACWQKIPQFFPTVDLDAFVIMPNHIHGIIVIVDGRGEASAEDPSIIRNGYMADASPLQDQGLPADGTPQHARPKGTMPGSLGATSQNFKPVSTRQLHKIGILWGKPAWQRNYFEHIIRSEAEWERICQYIEANPDRWAEDEENRQRSA